MSLSSMIRAAAGGSKKTRAEGDKPEEEMEDDVPPSEEDTAEGDQPEEEAEDNQPEEEATDDGDTDETMSASQMSASQLAAHASGIKSGRKAERSRIAAIMGNQAADANPSLAAHLALATDMKAGDAVATLKAGGTAGGKLAGRMAASGQPHLGGGAAPITGAATQPERIAAHAAAIIEAKRARGVR